MTIRFALKFAAVILFLTIRPGRIEQAAAQAPDIPSEVSGFSGEGLHLYPLGWSADGHWGGLIGRKTASDAESLTLLIIDAVSDKILFQSKPMDRGRDFATFWSLYGPSVRERIVPFGLNSSRRADVRNPEFTTGGARYTFHLTPPAPGRRAYTVSIESSRSGSKTVYTSSTERPISKAVILGSLISPFESRALAVIRETPAYREGEVAYRLIGSHLTAGFNSKSRYTARNAGTSSGSLLSAIFNGQEYLVRSRLQSGANPDERDERGYPALLVAARLGYWGMISDLLAAGADPGAVDKNGRTALHYASFEGSTEAVRALLAADASRTVRDKAGRTASDLAADSNTRALLN